MAGTFSGRSLSKRLNENLAHRPLRLELQIAHGALYPAVGLFIMLNEGFYRCQAEESSKWTNLIPRPLRPKRLITHGTSEGMFDVFMLGIYLSRDNLGLGKGIPNPTLFEI